MSQFHVYLPWVNASLAQCLNRFLNVKGESSSIKALSARIRAQLVVAFSVIVKLHIRNISAQPQSPASQLVSPLQGLQKKNKCTVRQTLKCQCFNSSIHFYFKFFSLSYRKFNIKSRIQRSLLSNCVLCKQKQKIRAFICDPSAILFHILNCELGFFSMCKIKKWKCQMLG